MDIEELLVAAEKEGVSPVRMLRESKQKEFLSVLHGNNLVLQGGGALRFLYDSDRLTDDLDFVYQDKQALNDAMAAARKISNDVQRVSKDDQLDRIKVYFPLSEQKVVCRIELCNVPAYSKHPIVFCGNNIQAEDLEEIASDKIVSIIGRAKRWGKLKETDIYDLFLIEKKFNKRPNIDFVKRKIADYNISLGPKDYKVIETIVNAAKPILLDVFRAYLSRDTYENLNSKELYRYIDNSLLNAITKCGI